MPGKMEIGRVSAGVLAVLPFGIGVIIACFSGDGTSPVAKLEFTISRIT